MLSSEKEIPKWKLGEFGIAVPPEQGGRKPVIGAIFGFLAVHACVGTEENVATGAVTVIAEFRVSHVRTGFRAAAFSDLADAVALAEKFGADTRWDFDDAKKVSAALGREVSSASNALRLSRAMRPDFNAIADDDRNMESRDAQT